MKFALSCVVNDTDVTIGSTYGSVPLGKPVALIGSHGFLEIAVNGQRADQLLSLDYDSEVIVQLAHVY